MKKSFRKVLAILLCAAVLIPCMLLGSFAAENSDKTLQFNKDGKFTILNFSDIQDGYPMKPITKRYLKDTLNLVKPDLVVLTGDNIAGYRTKTKSASKNEIKEFMDIFKAANVKVAMVFGNHDDEDNAADKAYQYEVYESYDNFIGGDYGKSSGRLGTLNIPILSSDGTKTAFNIWMTDSGTYNDENDKGGYGCVHKDQIEWYKETSAALKEANGGEPVYSINFQHIVVPEIWDALDEHDEKVDGSVEHGGKYYTLPEGAKGELGESPCPPEYTNGQFAAWLEQGDVIASVCGHDHINSYEIDYQGIKLINTPGIGFNSYNNHVVGSRVFVLDENNPQEFETYCLAYNDVYAEDDAVAQSLYELYSDETDTGTKIAAVFKYIFALFLSIFK